MDDLSYDKRGKVAWLRLCRPDQGNRLTPAMVADLAALCETVADDDEVEIVVLTGMGDVFCQGLEYPVGQKDAEAAQGIRAQFGELPCVAALAALTKPTLAVLNGDAIGVGLELALACDLRLAKEGAGFGLPQVADGLIPFCGGTQRLPRIVGQAKALELVLTGEMIDAREAQCIGLEEDLYALLQTTQDRAEGIRAFLGKRTAKFVGQ